MSTATARAYQPYFAGRFMPLKCEKARSIRLSTGIEVHIREKHIVSKIESC